MSNLLASLVSSAGTLETYGRVLETAQNNVANASTPGFAKQRVSLYALPFDPAGGSTGGVRAGQLVSSRNEYAESAVRQQTTGLGYQQQLVSSLTELEARFDITGSSGIPAALNSLFNSFSAWATTPGNQAARQNVVDGASRLASTFQQTFNALSSQARNAEQQIRQTVDAINTKVAEIQTYNKLALQGNKNDGGLSSRMHAALDELSELINFSAHFESDGSVSITIDGQTPLLLDDKQYKISTDLVMPQNPPPTYPDAPAMARVLGPDGSDITNQAAGGQLGALLQVRNQVLASYLGDAYQPGELNRLAKQFASRVNELLTNGQINAGPPPEGGVPIFTYDTNNDTAVTNPRGRSRGDAGSACHDQSGTALRLQRRPAGAFTACLAGSGRRQDRRNQLHRVLRPDRRVRGRPA
jgi:flagellar hook-associated protein 1